MKGGNLDCEQTSQPVTAISSALGGSSAPSEPKLRLDIPIQCTIDPAGIRLLDPTTHADLGTNVFAPYTGGVYTDRTASTYSLDVEIAPVTGEQAGLTRSIYVGYEVICPGGVVEPARLKSHR